MNYIPNTNFDRERILNELGKESVDTFFSEIPKNLLMKENLSLPQAVDEISLLHELKEISKKNLSSDDCVVFLGGGAYNHFIPSAVKHAVSRSEFLTTYTPYQAEISQGLLQLIYEFQSLICALFGMDVANASHYDGATSMAEAAILSCNYTNRNEVLISSCVNPLYIRVLKTYASGGKFTVTDIDEKDGMTDVDLIKEKISSNTACFILQMPNFFGNLEEVFEIEEIVHKNGALFVVSVNPISLGLLKKPSEYNADIVVAEGQSLGNELSFGGPYLGIFAAKKEFVRFVPGRIVGVTTDTDGKRGFVLTLQAREQHIRREKAFSNICSNQSFIALTAGAYLSYVGPKGLEKIAEISHKNAVYAYEKISKIDGFFVPFSDNFFNEFVVKIPTTPEMFLKYLADKKILVGPSLQNFYPKYDRHILLCFTEMNSKEQIDRLIYEFENFKL